MRQYCHIYVTRQRRQGDHCCTDTLQCTKFTNCLIPSRCLADDWSRDSLTSSSKRHAAERLGYQISLIIAARHRKMTTLSITQQYTVRLIASERYVRVFAVADPSACLSSVCNVGAPYSGGWTLRQYFFTAVYLGHPLTSVQNFKEIVPREPLRRGPTSLKTTNLGIWSSEPHFGEVEGDARAYLGWWLVGKPMIDFLYLH